MEGTENVNILILLGTATIVFFAVIVILFFILYHRKTYVKEILKAKFENELQELDTKYGERIESLEKEVSEIKKGLL